MKNKENLFYVDAIIFFMVAVTELFTSGFSEGAVWLAFGFTFLCLGSLGKMKNDEKYISHKEEKNNAEH